MSTTTTTTEQAPSPAATQHFATLIRGRIYILGSKEFENGRAVAITAEEKEWLEAHAVDYVTVEDEGEHQARQKFEFSTGAAAAPTRSRSR